MLRRTYDIVNAGPRNRFMTRAGIVSNSGRIFQIHNLPSRGILKADDIEQGIWFMKRGYADVYTDEVMRLASSALRGTVLSSPGHKLCVSDWANIEGRLVAWVAGEQWKLEAFKDFDAGTGADLYKLAYAKSFQKPLEDVTASDRDLGKVLELACFGPDTMVLTDNGLKKLVDVTTDDKVWDGVNWTTHGGVISRGIKEVISIKGTYMTPDHLIFCQGDWLPAHEFVRDPGLLGRATRDAVTASQPAYSYQDWRRYESTYYRAGGVPAPHGEQTTMEVYDLLDAGPKNRFTICNTFGPLIVHNCGYAGGVGAFVTFALGYGMDLEQIAVQLRGTLPTDLVAEATKYLKWRRDQNMGDYGLTDEVFITCDVLKRAWRNAHPTVVQVWANFENSAKAAISDPGQEYWVNEHVSFKMLGSWLFMKLSSGRALCYPGAYIKGKTIMFEGQHPLTKRWGKQSTYSGKLLENFCQAMGAEILYHSLPRVEARGFKTLFHVHDEPVAETLDNGELSHVDLSEVMTQGFDWVDGLPLFAKGFDAYRYRK